MSVVLDHVLAERAPREWTGFERIHRLRKGVRHARQRPGGVDVADEALRRLDPVGDAVQARGERGREREVGIAVGARDAALDAQARAVADDAEARGAVVVAPGKPSWRPGR